MAEQFKMDTSYRQTEEYKLFMASIKKDVPWIPQALAEACIIAHKTDPTAYKKDKHAKSVFQKPIEPPKNKGEIVVDKAVQVGDVTDDIVKQRDEFWEKHTPKEETTTIEEVEA